MRSPRWPPKLRKEGPESPGMARGTPAGGTAAVPRWLPVPTGHPRDAPEGPNSSEPNVVLLYVNCLFALSLLMGL